MNSTLFWLVGKGKDFQFAHSGTATTSAIQGYGSFLHWMESPDPLEKVCIYLILIFMYLLL